MELPHQYWPVKVCPHVGERPHRRLRFADYGSHENVNLTTDEERSSIKFFPQKEQGYLKGLASNLPSLPLFDIPFEDKLRKQDNILGLHGLSKTINDLIYLVKVIQRFKGCLRNNPESDFAKKCETARELVDQCLRTKESKKTETGTTDTPSEDVDVDLLNENLSKGIQALCEKYMALSKAHNDDCLNGYNRDFYGGLVAVTQSGYQSGDILVHAGNESFKDIYITSIEEDGVTGLKHPKVQAKVTVEDRVFQVCVSTKQEGKVLACARHMHHCTLLCHEESGKSPVQHNTETLEDDITSACFSPYLGNELLMSAKNGVVYLWDINSKPRRLLEKPSSFESCIPWSCAYFGGHPRQIVVADNSSVDIFDHRTNFCDGVELFSLSPRIIKVEERVMAAASLGFPYHAVATDYSLFVMDQRYGSTPVLQWSPEFIGAPQYIQVLQNLETDFDTSKMLFLASQQPAEVMCFSIGIAKGCAPVSPILPFKVSQIGEFSEVKHTSFTCDLNQVEKRFEASLAGFTVSPISANGSFTVYQMDSCGDLFYQTFNPDETQNQRNRWFHLRETTEFERKAADHRAGHWLKNLETFIRSQQGLNCRAANSQIDSAFFNAVFTRLDSEDEEIINNSAPSEGSSTTIQPRLHKNLKSLDELPSDGSSAQLHLALRDNREIKEILEKREADHLTMRKKLREENLRKQVKKSIPVPTPARKKEIKAIITTPETPGMYKSKEFISSNDESDSSEDFQMSKPGLSNDVSTCHTPCLQHDSHSESSMKMPTQQEEETPILLAPEPFTSLRQRELTFDPPKRLETSSSESVFSGPSQIFPYRLDHHVIQDSSNEKLSVTQGSDSPSHNNKLSSLSISRFEHNKDRQTVEYGKEQNIQTLDCLKPEFNRLQSSLSSDDSPEQSYKQSADQRSIVGKCQSFLIGTETTQGPATVRSRSKTAAIEAYDSVDQRLALGQAKRKIAVQKSLKQSNSSNKGESPHLKKPPESTNQRKTPGKHRAVHADRKHIPKISTSNQVITETEAQPSQISLSADSKADKSLSPVSSDLSDIIPFQQEHSQSSNVASQPAEFSQALKDLDVTSDTGKKLEVFNTPLLPGNVQTVQSSSPYVCASIRSVSPRSPNFPLLQSTSLRSPKSQQIQNVPQSSYIEPNTTVAFQPQQHSPSLFSSASGMVDAANKVTWEPNKSQELSSSEISRQQNVVKWLLHSVTSNPSTPVKSPDTTQAQNTETGASTDPVSTRRKLSFDRSLPLFDSDTEISKNRQNYSDSESDNSSYDSEPSILSSLHSVLSTVNLTTPKMQRLADPSLAGFLSSPRNERARKSLKLKKGEISNPSYQTENQSPSQTAKNNVSPSKKQIADVSSSVKKNSSWTMKQNESQNSNNSSSIFIPPSRNVSESVSTSKSSKRKKSQDRIEHDDQNILQLDLHTHRKSKKHKKHHTNK